MKREIKFRAWHELNKQMIYPHGRSFFDILSSGDILNRFEVVMQYTGLKDRNGKEIYEGDIIKHPICEIGKVIFFQPYAGFTVSRGEFLYDLNDTKEFEVIGNIYENPELQK